MRPAIAILILISSAAPAADPDVHELYEKARMLVESNRDLSEAIRLFGQVVSLARGQRPIAAQAQYRQGLVFERLGRKAEAQRAFRAVVQDFPEQRSLVAMAAARLPAALQPGIINHQVWTGDDADSTGRVSPEGRLFGYTDSTGNIALRDLETGEHRRVTRKATPASESYYMFPVFSTDLRRLAYVRFQDPNPDEVWTIGLDGADDHMIYRAGLDDHLVQLCDWSPDGRLLTVQKKTSKRPQMVLLSPNASARTLPLSDRWVGGCGWFSRDGKHIAYDFLQNGEPSGFDIHLFTIADGSDAALVRHPANDNVVGWSPDGGMLLFTSTRTGSAGLYGVAVAAGKSASEPALLAAKTDIFWPVGITRRGSLFYGVGVGQQEVMVAELDLNSGIAASAPVSINQRFEHSKRAGVWSPDGSLLAYGSPRGVSIHSLATGEERDLIPQPYALDRLLWWHPDGGSIFGTGSALDGTRGIVKMNVQTGRTEMVAQGLTDPPAFSTDASTIYYTDFSGNLISRDLLTGGIQVLYTAGPAMKNPSAELSPDGKLLAFLLQNQPKGSQSLMLMPSGGGLARTLLQIPGPDKILAQAFRFSPDMRSLLLFRTSKGQSTLWRLPLDGGPAQNTGLTVTSEAKGLRLGPDGRHISFLNGTAGDAEIWALENFLPVPPRIQTRR